jgi:acyl carrier protein
MALTREGLLDFFRQELGVDTADVTDRTPLFSSGLLDSFSMLDLVLFIESEEDIRLEPGDVRMQHMDSVERILQFVQDWQESSP